MQLNQLRRELSLRIARHRKVNLDESRMLAFARRVEIGWNGVFRSGAVSWRAKLREDLAGCLEHHAEQLRRHKNRRFADAKLNRRFGSCFERAQKSFIRRFGKLRVEALTPIWNHSLSPHFHTSYGRRASDLGEDGDCGMSINSGSRKIK